uniref:Uncharacterized protein n=1 Tax=Glossina austeni TaxID=7395 RepID=A0A1A9VE25_GLOAU
MDGAKGIIIKLLEYNIFIETVLYLTGLAFGFCFAWRFGFNILRNCGIFAIFPFKCCPTSTAMLTATLTYHCTVHKQSVPHPKKFIVLASASSTSLKTYGAHQP